MRILVLGSTGMLGSAIVRELKERNLEFFAPTRRELDLSVGENTSNYFRNTQPEIVFHCAALVGGIEANILGGPKFLTQNLMIDQNVLDSAYELSTPKLIYVGSSCMYPANRDNMLLESDLLTGSLEPTNQFYAIAKILGVKTIESLSSKKNLNWTSVISSNLYGPGDNFDLENSHLLASIIRKVCEAEKVGANTIPVWGDGAAKREFTFVEDLAQWLVTLSLGKERWPKIMNAGFGEDLTVKQWYELVIELAQSNVQLTFDMSKPVGNKRKLMDSTLAKQFGWAPKTNPVTGVNKTLAWYRKNHIHE